MTQDYIPLCPVDELEDGAARGFDLDERAIVVVRRQQQVWAYINSCPHRGIRLEWMPDQFLDVDGLFIQCATHGALFNIHDGMCVSGPCQGIPLQPVDCRIINGEIQIESS